MALDLNTGAGPATGVLRSDAAGVLPDLATLERALGRHSQRTAAAFRSLEEAALAEAGALLQPAAVWAEIALEFAELLVPGAPRAMMVEARALVGVVCTIGERVEAQAHRHFAGQEYTRGYLLDQAGTLAVGRLAQQVAELLRAERNAARWAPGDDEGDWRMDAQRLLCELVPAGAIGVRLTEHNVMVPAKSLSFVLLVGSRPAGLECLGECRRCLWKGNCAGRRGRQAAVG